ncbi:MAG: HAD family hydrolase [Actinocatenispora sp.]
MTTAGVILDLDGTVVDSNYLHVAAWWSAFRENDTPVATADVHQLLGRPSAELVEELVPDAPEDRRQAIVDAHSRHYGPYLERVGATRGAGDLMRALYERGLRVVVATSAKSDQVDTMLAATGAAGTVHTVVDSSDAERGKPAPDPVALALRRGDLDADRSVMLGDAVWDVLTAHRAGVRCVALTCGGIAASRLSEAGADAVYRDPRDLLEQWADSPLGELVG